MTGLRGRIRALLLSQKGETIMEGVVSLLIFSVLLAAVSVMISTSLRITSSANARANTRAQNANGAILESAGDPATLELVDTANGIDIEISVTIPENESFTAFYPQRS